MFNECVMMERQNADGVAEESFRNIKTILSLGAQKKFFAKYFKIMKDCYTVGRVAIHVSSMWYALSMFTSQFADALMYLSAVVIVMGQRKSYPTELVNEGCVAAGLNSVDFCYSAANMTSTCRAICDRVDTCWFDRQGPCLVGGEVVVVMMAVLQAISGIGSAFSSIIELTKARVAAAFFLEVIDHKDEMVDKKGEKPASNKGDIVFSDMSFKYKSRDVMILNHLNLTIHENEMIGIVGESGCGKSTILKLLMRLYGPSSGVISWNGVNVEDLSMAWIRDQISYVAQEPVLFSGTIRENLLYGRVDASEEEMVEAAKLVKADGFIRQFPKGYDTYVGELGSSLSGGQKQRIAIARALLRHPCVLVLDEATSALDSQSEEIVQEALNRIREEKRLSIVVVAHRLSSIRVCDRIVVMEKGAVAEEGTHDELMKRGGLYAGLYASQGTALTPVEESAKSVEKKSTEMEKEESSTALTKKESEEKEEETPDEIPESEMKHVNIVSLLKKTHTTTILFWLGFIGTALRVVFPPLYSYSSAVLQHILYDHRTRLLSQLHIELDHFWSQGWFSVYLIIFAALCTLVGSFIQWDLHGLLGERLIGNIRTETFGKLMNMDAGFYDSPLHIPSILVSRLSIDGRRIRDLIDRLGTISENYILVAASLALCFSPLGDWRLSVISILLSPFCVITIYLQNNFLFQITEQVDTELVKRSGDLTDYMLNIHIVHAYNLENVLDERLNHLLRTANGLTRRRVWRSAVGYGVSQFMPCIYQVVVLLSGFVMMQRGMISFTQMLTVYMMVGTCSFTVGMNLAYTPNNKLAQKSSNNIVAILDRPSKDDAGRAATRKVENGDIVFDNVTFAYPTRHQVPILKGVSFTIPKNASVAFVGHSGCGKSTIMALLQRFYSPDSGVISLSGVDVNELNLDWFRSELGVVNQEPCMFSGTIRENVLMGVDGEVSDEELKRVCEEALCMDFINEMPDGFETDLGATGKSLSGGQKQRLALARAILRKPSILLLDEATSALDSENQEKFLEALKRWRSGHPCTVVTVAHRLSTIVDSDIIFMCENGVVVGSGSHEELLKSCESYVDLVRGQMSWGVCLKGEKISVLETRVHCSLT